MESDTEITPTSDGDIVDAAKAASESMDRADAEEREERLAAEAGANAARNVTLTETDMHMFGDRGVIAQVVQLVAYIRHAVKNNLQTEITVRIGNTVANSEFMFDVNGCQVPDLRTQPVAEVN